MKTARDEVLTVCAEILTARATSSEYRCLYDKMCRKHDYLMDENGETEIMRKRTLAVMMGTILLALSVCGCGESKSGSTSDGADNFWQTWGSGGGGDTQSGSNGGAQSEGADTSILPVTSEALFNVTDTEGGVSIVYNDIEGGDFNIPAEIGGKKVVEIGERAFWCIMLTSVIIPDSVTKIGEAAFNLTNLEQVVIPESVTQIDRYAFLNCTRLTDVTILGGITKIEEMTFSGCPVLTNVTLPPTLTEIGTSAFAKCRSLTHITLPDSVIAVDPSAFSGCTGITVTYKGTDYSYEQLNDLYTVLDDAASVAPPHPAEEFFMVEDVPGGVSIYQAKGAVGLYYYNGEEGIVRIPEQIGGKTVVEIGPSVFVGSRYIVDLTIPETVVRIGGSAFNGCYELVRVTLPSGLTELEQYLFAWNEKLEEVSIPPTATRLGDGVFVGCKSLKRILVPEGVTEIGYFAFSECPNLELVILPDSLTTIKDEVFEKSENVTVTYKGVSYTYDEIDALYSAIRGGELK